MEIITNQKPAYWSFTNPQDIISETVLGRVHSGNASVNMRDQSILSQRITGIEGDCFYAFSFFARGEGSQVGFTARVIFETATQSFIGATIIARQQDIPSGNRAFEFYRILTSAAPAGTITALIQIEVSASSNQSLDLDDISFAVQ